MTLQYIVDSYGYAAIFIGTFLEGETILVLGGVAAKLDYLEFPLVIICAFAGTFLGDQFLFFLGRHKGEALLEKWPIWRERADKVMPVIERHRLLIILGFRFLYGMRTIIPFAIGMSRVSILEFLLLNAISATVWSSLVGVLGYALGHGMELFLGDIRHYEEILFSVILIVGVSMWLMHRFRR